MQQDYGYQQDRGLQTPPGSRRELNHASVLRRIGAYLIDGLLLGLLVGLVAGVILFTGFMAMPEPTDPSGSFMGMYLSIYFIFITVFSALVGLLYFTYFESKSGGGATPAKRLLSIQVVDDRGRNVSATDSFIRNIARWLWSLPCIGFIILIVDVILIASDDQRIGDQLAGTYVVKEKGGSIYKYSQSQGPGPQGYQGQGQYQRSQAPPQQPQQSRQSQPPPPRQREEKACPDCGKPMKYIQEAHQWYCYSCGEYK